MPEKNMLNTVVTCARPPRTCPTIACDRLAMRITMSADVMSSPTSRKNGIAIRLSESMPLNSWPIMLWKVMGVIAVPTITPAISANATGTPR